VQVLLVRALNITEILPACDGILVGLHPFAGEASNAVGHYYQGGFEAQRFARLFCFEARNPA
jgi:hypothetical protein